MESLTNSIALLPKGSKPKVVFFDLWRTMAHSLDKEPILQVQGILGHKSPAEDAHGKPALDLRFLRTCLTTNIGDPERFLHHVAGEFGCPPVTSGAVAQFKEVLGREFDNLAIYGDTHPVLSALQAHGYRLGVISNLWAFPANQLFEVNGLSAYFEHKIYSFEVGHSKPEPEIFMAACARFGVDPHECLMVGDHPDSDIRGALAVGMNAVMIDRERTWDEDRIPQGIPVIRTLVELQDALIAR